MSQINFQNHRFSGLSRRKFIRYGAIATGMGILAACTSPTASTDESPTASTSPSPAGGLFETIKQRGYFTYGLEAGYRPFGFYDDTNKLIGYDIDLADALGKRWGVESRPVPTNWATVIQTMYDGGFDLILGGMTATEERYKRANFSVPYMDASSGLLVRVNGGIVEKKDLNNRIVGTKAGTPSIKQLEMTEEELGIKYSAAMKTFPEDTAGIEALRSKRIDAYASSVVSMLEVAKENPGFEVIPFKSERWATEYTCAAFRKEDEDFRTAFNDAILAMQADGSLYELQRKWFNLSFEDLPKEPPVW